MKTLTALLLTLFTFSVSAQITDIEFMDKSPYVQNFKKVHKEAVLLIKDDKYSEAWKLLLPSAKQGDENSMYILGKMIITTPSLHDKMATARKLLTKSAQKGHALASHALKEMDAIKTVEQISKQKLPNMEVDDEARQRYEEAMKRYAAKEMEKPWSVEYLVFFNSFDPKFNIIIKQMTDLKYRLKEKINIRYVFVARLENMQSKLFSKPTPGFMAPTSGFELDADGQMAKRMNIESFPAILATSDKGSHSFIIDENSNVINPLMKFYRSKAQ